METTTLDACFKKYVSAENFHLLDNEITDEKHISQIADEITDWKDLRSYFEISYPTQQVIINDNPGNYKGQKAAFVQKLVEKNVTYRKLCTVLHKRKKLNLVRHVCTVMQPSVLQRQSTSPRNPDTHLEAAALTPVPAPPRAPAPPSLHTTHKCKILGVFHSDAMQGAVAEAQGGSKLPHDLPSAYWRLEQILEKAFVREECTIAIIDTGIKISHKAFQGNRRLHAGSRILHIMNCLAAPDASDDIKSDVSDVEGHGTHCAGVAAGNIPCTVMGMHDHAKCFRGVAPHANLIIYKVADCKNDYNIEAIVKALDDLIEIVSNKIHVVNVLSMSFGCFSSAMPTADKEDIERRIKTLTRLNVICVAAAGNYGDSRHDSVLLPAKFTDTICIGAHDGKGKPCGFTPSGTTIDFLGPGYNIKGPSIVNDDSYCNDSGTSSATPAIAGLICLFIQRSFEIYNEPQRKLACDFVCRTKNMYELLKKSRCWKDKLDKDFEAGYGPVDPLPLLKLNDDSFFQILIDCGLEEFY